VTREARRAEIQGGRPRTGERFLSMGQRSPSQSTRDSGEHSKLLHSGVRGGAQTAKSFWSLDVLSPENASIVATKRLVPVSRFYSFFGVRLCQFRML